MPGEELRILLKCLQARRLCELPVILDVAHAGRVNATEASEEAENHTATSILKWLKLSF